MKILHQIDVSLFGACGDDDDGDAAVAEAERIRAEEEAKLMTCSPKPEGDEDWPGTEAGDFATEEETERTVGEFLESETRTRVFRAPRDPIDRAMSKYQRLTAEDERVMLETLPHDAAAKNLVLHSLRFASYVAGKFYRNSPMSYEDRRQVALMAMIKAADMYGCDPKNYTMPDGTRRRFVNFAYSHIMQALSRCCNPKWGSNDAKTMTRTELVSTEIVTDIDKTLDFLCGGAMTVCKIEDDGEYVNAIIQSIETLVKQDGNKSFSNGEANQLMFMLKQRLAGFSNHDIAAMMGLTATALCNKLNRLKIFLLRQSLRENPILKDLKWLFERSYWMKAGRSMGAEICNPSTVLQERSLYRDLRKRVEVQPYQKPLPHNSKACYEKYNRARVKSHSNFIPWKSYSGPLKPRTSCPTHGHFYTTEAFQRFSTCP